MGVKNSVYIATSIDGYIADKEGKIDWLHSVPNPENSDMGFGAFTATIDALVMGRNTFETVCGFDIPWPYEKPVFVLSNRLKTIPDDLKEKVFLVNGTLTEVLSKIHALGYKRLYIDGGTTIQSFLREDLVDELILSTIPVVLGGGVPLFGELAVAQSFELKKSDVLIGQVVQSHFVRKKE